MSAEVEFGCCVHQCKGGIATISPIVTVGTAADHERSIDLELAPVTLHGPQQVPDDEELTAIIADTDSQLP